MCVISCLRLKWNVKGRGREGRRERGGGVKGRREKGEKKREIGRCIDRQIDRGTDGSIDR